MALKSNVISLDGQGTTTRRRVRKEQTILRYGYMRARTRAVAAAAGAALVVVPLTGAAAAALVSQDATDASVPSHLLALETVNDVTAADIPAVAGEVAASEDADFDVAAPEIDVKKNPPPPPVV